MSNIIVPSKKTIKMRCGYCPRVIFKEDETDGTFKRKDGKIMCPVCRATKLTKFKGEIARGGKDYLADKDKQEAQSRANAVADVVDIAVASQERAGDDYRIQK